MLNQHLQPQAVAKLLAIETLLHPSPEQEALGAKRTFDDALNRLKSRQIKVAHAQLLEELRQVEARGEETDELVRRMQNLNRRKRELKNPQRAS